MKNTRGSTKAGPLMPMPLNREVAITKMSRPVMNREQMKPATKDSKKNHLMHPPQLSSPIIPAFRLNSKRDLWGQKSVASFNALTLLDSSLSQLRHQCHGIDCIGQEVNTRLNALAICNQAGHGRLAGPWIQ